MNTQPCTAQAGWLTGLKVAALWLVVVARMPGFPPDVHGAEQTSSSPPPIAIRLTSPVNYQVFQRHSASSGVLRLRGRTSVEKAEWTCRISAPPRTGTVSGEWQTLPPGLTNGLFAWDITVPAGGWYRLDLRASDGENLLGDAKVDHVGIGEVFIVAGQSNSSNHGSEKQETSTGKVSAFGGTNWILSRDPQPGGSGGGGSFIPAFGDALHQRLGVPIGIASLGVGATSVRQWLPQGERMTNRPTIHAYVKAIGPNEWESTGELFQRLMDRMDTLGPRGFRAVLWHQGESDAGQARGGYPAEFQISGTQYREFLTRLIIASRNHAGWDVPWFVAQATYHSEEDAADEEFRAAQRALWESGLAMEGPDTDALRREYRDGVHFNAKGLKAHGEQWAEKVRIHLNPVQP